jgi:hypothetical protein
MSCYGSDHTWTIKTAGAPTDLLCDCQKVKWGNGITTDTWQIEMLREAIKDAIESLKTEFGSHVFENNFGLLLGALKNTEPKEPSDGR